MKKSDEMWACTACRSINAKRSDRCYRCFTPRAAAGVAPTELPTIGHAAPPPIAGRYRDSRIRALLVSMAVVMAAVSTGAIWWMLHEAGQALSAGADDAAGSIMDQSGTIFAWWLVSVGITLVAYGAWISRVVENLPALGLGYSRVSPRTAFFEPLIVGFNMASLPARVGEVLRRLDHSRRGEGIIAAAYVAFIAPLLVMLLFNRAAFFFTPRTERYADMTTIGLIGFGVQAIGFALVIVLIWHVERRCRERAAAVAGRAPAATEPSTVTAT